MQYGCIIKNNGNSVIQGKGIISIISPFDTLLCAVYRRECVCVALQREHFYPFWEQAYFTNNDGFQLGQFCHKFFFL